MVGRTGCTYGEGRAICIPSSSDGQMGVKHFLNSFFISSVVELAHCLAERTRRLNFDSVVGHWTENSASGSVASKESVSFSFAALFVSSRFFVFLMRLKPAYQRSPTE